MRWLGVGRWALPMVLFPAVGKLSVDCASSRSKSKAALSNVDNFLSAYSSSHLKTASTPPIFCSTASTSEEKNIIGIIGRTKTHQLTSLPWEFLGRTMSVESAKPKANLLQSMGLGGTAAMFAVNFTHPIETVKTRMQVSGLGIGSTCSSLMADEGVLAFWKGLPFAYGRELSYTSIKLGAYAPVRDAMEPLNEYMPAFLVKFLAGAVTGGVGSVVGNPFDVMKTLAQTNKDKTVGLGALVTNMLRDQGVAGFYRGVGTNIGRACVLNATKMGVYDMTKGYVTSATGWSRKDVRTAASSSFVAGFFMTCTVSPFDNIRTRLMNQPTDAKLYDGLADCFVKTVKSDGVASLWRGFIPIWARFAPQATLQLLTIEALYGYFGFRSI